MIRRTTIEIDDVLLAEAADVLGTTGMRETVHRALDEVVRARLRRELAEQLRTGEGLDIHDPAVFAVIRAPRFD